MNHDANGQVVQATNLRSYFHESINRAVHNQGVDASDETLAYLINLLTEYARSDQLFESTNEEGYTLRPLAELFFAATHADCVSERNEALRRLGDVALFISGLFANSLSRKIINIDYYVSMGGSAYGWLSESSNHPQHSAEFTVFEELSHRFVDFVDVLNEVGEKTSNNDCDTLQTYETWLRTGSQRAARKLHDRGIHFSTHNVSTLTH